MITLAAWTSLSAALLSAATAPAACRDRSGERNGSYAVLWHDTGSACLTPGVRGSYKAAWSLGARGNMVAGLGWSRGRLDARVRYRAVSFDPGSNGYLSLYGWSRHPLVEYYVVDDYGPFVPPGPGAVRLGTFESDGGTYAIYRTERVNAPSIAGNATFPQYWSVRTSPRPIGHENAITFANHLAAWRAAGLTLGRLDYQILATEGYGSRGQSEIEGVSR